jgi:hypothetical protein
MRDFAYLFNAKAQFGCKPWNLKFDHPGWVKFQNAVPADATVALVDNTTLHQALIVMREGLGQAESNYAVLLPDLTTLFFAYAYFDRVVVLDKGLTDEERAVLAGVLPDLTVIPWTDLAYLRDEEGRQLDEINHLEMVTIQERFFQRHNLHPAWSEAYSTIYRNKIRPVHFGRESQIDSLLNTPIKMVEAWTGQVDPITPGTLAQGRSERPLWARWLKRDEDVWSSIASYHTYRTMFYYSLANAFEWAYLPCGLRGVATDLLPLEALKGENHVLNPDYTHVTLALARSSAELKKGLEQLHVQLPVWQINPTLAALLGELRNYEARHGFDKPWRPLAKEWREASFETRSQFRNWFQALKGDPFDPEPMKRMERALEGHPGLKVNLITDSIAVAVAAFGAGLSALSPDNELVRSFHNKTLTDALLGIAKDTPSYWKSVSGLGLRRKMKFLLRSHDLAGNILDGEEACRAVWGRTFSDVERRYLSDLKKINPVYGI